MAHITEQRIVLLVDDDVMIRNLLRRSLESADFTVFSAADAPEAIEISRSFPNHIELLIADVELPEMDGVVLAEQITRERPDTAVLFMSAGTERSIPEGFVFISKPFLPAELLEKIAAMLSRPNAHTASRPPSRPAN